MKVMIHLKSCPRCIKGQMFREFNIQVCLQCGYREYIKPFKPIYRVKAGVR